LIPAYWYSTLALYLWQVTVHSMIIAIIGMVWLHRQRLPSGTARRQVLALILVLPLVTAAIPGRGGTEFRHLTAWADSHRLLLLPVGSRLHVFHLVLGLAGLVMLLTVWQELVPVLRRRKTKNGRPPPADLVDFAHSLPGWGGCSVDVDSGREVMVATGGWPPHPRLHLSKGALEELSADEVRIVIRHEHAHWRGWRWSVTHLLFAARLVQLFNPVALWAFREYIVELEIACDLAAIEATDSEPLARALFKVYRASHPGEVAARATVRRRIDVLLGRIEISDEPLPLPLAGAITLTLLLVVPWIV